MKVTHEVTIKNEYGIHARPASMFVKVASRYDADIIVEKDGSGVPGKSIMGIMTLQACHGTKLLLVADGDDAEDMIAALVALVESNFEA
jgi:phosphocarrier protein